MFEVESHSFGRFVQVSFEFKASRLRAFYNRYYLQSAISHGHGERIPEMFHRVYLDRFVESVLT